MYKGQGLSPQTLEWSMEEYAGAFQTESPKPASCVMLDGLDMLLTLSTSIVTTEGLRDYFRKTVMGLLEHPSNDVQWVVMVFPRGLVSRTGDPVDLARYWNHKMEQPASLSISDDEGMDPRARNEFDDLHHYSLCGDDRIDHNDWIQHVMTPSIYMFEILPLIGNAFTNEDKFFIPSNKWVVFWGLPMEVDNKMDPEGGVYEGTRCSYLRPTNRLSIHTVQHRAHIFNRVAVMKTAPVNILPGESRKWFFFDMHRWNAPLSDPVMVFIHLFNHIGRIHSCLIMCSNSELIPVSLLFARDHHFEGKLYLRVTKPNTSAFSRRRFTYVDVQRLYTLIQFEHSSFHASTQNKLLYYTLICAITGNSLLPTPFPSDKDGYVFHAIQTTVDMSCSFSHVAQLSLALPHCKQELRFPVIDEYGFKQLMEWIQTRMAPITTAQSWIKGKESMSTDSLIIMTDDQITRYARMVTYVLQYWLNGYRNPVAFTSDQGIFFLGKQLKTGPYYGFEVADRLLDNGDITQVLERCDNCSKDRPAIPLAYLRHFITHKRQRSVAQPAGPLKKRKVCKQSEDDVKRHF